MTPKIRLLLSIIVQFLGIVAFAFWVFGAFFAPMLFAGGGSAATWTVFALMLAMPVLVALACIALWVAHLRDWQGVWGVSCALILLSFVPFSWT